jgi:hypothetical protein
MAEKMLLNTSKASPTGQLEDQLLATAGTKKELPQKERLSHEKLTNHWNQKL